MIALFNFNSYLGGGETIFTRWAEYLNKKGVECRLFYPEQSFIADELLRLGIPDKNLCPFSGNPNYYYLTDKERASLVNWIYEKLKGLNDVKLVSFCSRELYTLIDVAKKDSS